MTHATDRWALQETGVVPIADQAQDPLTESDFEIDDAFLEGGFALSGGLPSIDPAATLRSTQHNVSDDESSNDDDAAGLAIDAAEIDNHQAVGSRHETEQDVFELVSDSNSEDESETSFAWRSFVDH